MLTLALDSTGERTPVVHAASYVVNTLADSGLGSLRQAILDANAAGGPDTITFSVSGTIVLATGLPDITDSAGLVIDGSGQAVVVSGNNAVRPFTVAAPANLRALTIADGRVSGKGGGILNSGTLTVTNSTIRDNHATAPSGSGGGGIFNSGTLTVSNSTISGNNTTRAGGGIYHGSGTLTVSNSTISGNNATDAGGGIYHGSGTLTVSNSTISGNTASGLSGAGGGIRSGFGTSTITNSTISGNTADGGMQAEGGGIRNESGTLTITNSTVSGNMASSSVKGAFGGGILSSGTLTVINSTISGNTATGRIVGAGGGISNRSGTLTITNNIVTGNTPGDCLGSLTAVGPNLFGNPNGCTITGTPPITGDPLLGALMNNGGPTRTHTLHPSSPAIDAGDDALCAAAPVNGKDQRGVVRPQGPHCDLGAFERQVSDSVPPFYDDFEAGAIGWTLTGLLDGIARVEFEGFCFGANNTRGITLNGSRALNVRSSPGALLGSTGIATSSPFTFGTALTFRALSENDDAILSPGPVSFDVVIRTEAGAQLAVHAVKPNILTTSPGTSNDGCLVGELRDGPWSSHSIDTSAYAGQLGRVEFRQHTNVPGKGFFTLVDDVAVAADEPPPLFAGMRMDVAATNGNHTTTYEVHFDDPKREAERAQYFYSWSIVLGSDCAGTSTFSSPFPIPVRDRGATRIALMYLQVSIRSA